MKHGHIKNLFFPFILFVTFLLAIIWIQTKERAHYIGQILQQVNQIIIDDHNLQNHLQNSVFDTDTETLIFHNEILLRDIQDLYDEIKNNFLHEHYELHMTEAILTGIQMRSDVIEDFKTHNATISNSLMWLRNLEDSGQIKSEEAWYFHRLLEGYYKRDLLDTMPVFAAFGDPLISQHLSVLYEHIILLNKIRFSLDYTRTDGLLEKLKKHYEIDYIELETRRNLLMWMFLGGILFSLILMLYLYTKERRSTHRTLQLTNELEQIFDALSSTNIVSKTDLEGRITYVNDTFCLVSGYTRDELIGKSHNIIRHKDTPKELFVNLWSTIQSGKVFNAIIKNRRKDGKAYYVESTIMPIKNESDEITEYLAIRTDVTALIKARDEAIAAEHFKDRFLSNMSHELRTPLNGIIGFTQLLEDKITESSHKKYLNIILQSSNQLLSIINDILDLSKIKSGKFELEKHPFNAYNALTQQLEPFSIQAKNKKIDFTTSIDIDDSVILNGDWTRISQILNNLLSNALKFTSEEGKVSFKATYNDGFLECKVADSGIGMDEKTIDRIFQPFIQADISTTREFGGTGLGLSITKELVELMDGEIDVYSKPGVGSRFTVRMALESKELSFQKPEMNTDPSLSFPQLSGHVLIVEDNETNRLLIISLIEAFGLSYESAADGQEAVELFEQDRFDLILMDENMPRLNGIEAMKQIRKLPGGTLPIIALTANVMQGDKERFLNEGMDAFMGKPILYQDLMETLQRYLPLKN